MLSVKGKKRKSEKLWRKSKLTVHLETYKDKCKPWKKIRLTMLSMLFFRQNIENCAGDQKENVWHCK